VYVQTSKRKKEKKKERKKKERKKERKKKERKKDSICSATLITSCAVCIEMLKRKHVSCNYRIKV